MPFDKQNPYLNPVAEFPDVPSPSMTPAQIKAQFDSSPEEIRVTFNKLVDDLFAITAPTKIGASVPGITGTTLQQILEALKNLTLSVQDSLVNKTDKAGDHPGTWQTKNYNDILAQISVALQKYDVAEYLVSPGGFRFQMGVNDDGTLFSYDWDGVYPSWFNPNSPDGNKWNLYVEDDGAVNTVKV